VPSDIRPASAATLARTGIGGKYVKGGGEVVLDGPDGIEADGRCPPHLLEVLLETEPCRSSGECCTDSARPNFIFAR